MKFRYASALALALFFLEVVGCKRPKGAATRQPEEGVASSAQVQRELPPEPPPALADKAGDVPGLEAALAKDAAYQKVWSGPRGDLNTFLSVVSELIATGGSMPTAAS